MTRTISARELRAFGKYLQNADKSAVTVEKYLRDAGAFAAFADGKPVTKAMTLAYRGYLQARNYAVRSINSMLAGVNGLLDFLGWADCKVKTLRTQRRIYCAAEKQLTKEEYLRLLRVSRNRPQLNLVLQTICGTGIRVSELKYFTVETVSRGEVMVRCKSKSRTILIPGKLKKLLLNFARERGIAAGCIFVTKGGNPLDRSNIWQQMKSLCTAADVAPSKVFPHNLRKLFARTFYGIEKDIAKLADILGHGSVETTRIYIMTTSTEHRRKIERLGLVV